MNQEESKRRILERVDEETLAARDYVLPMQFDLHTLMCLVGALQLALRHPANTGPSSQVVRHTIDAIIRRVEEDGLTAVGVLLRLGDNPEFDE